MHISELSWRVLVTAPCFAKMRRHPEYQGWADALARLGESSEVAPFRQVLGGIITDALVTFKPLEDFLTGEAAGIDEISWYGASEAALEAAEACPPAALILAYVCLTTWVHRVGYAVYDQDPDGSAERGWSLFPYNLAYVGARSGAHQAALQVIEHAYDVLSARKFLTIPPIIKAMERYRSLARDCAEALERSIQDLADEMRAACVTDQPGLRAEFGAVLWTLGLVPHSLSFCPSKFDTGLPGHRFARDVVRRSIDRMATDRLLHYVWLELSKNNAIHIREHEGLFAIVNRRYPDPRDYTILEVVLGEEPGPLYARTVTEWFRGTLTEEDANRYASKMSYLRNTGLRNNWAKDWDATILRMDYLATLLDEQLRRRGGLAPAESEVVQLARNWISHVSRIRREIILWPELPDPQATMNPWLHEIIERELSEESAGVRPAWDLLEEFRSSALDYWMAVTPPRFPDPELNLFGKGFARQEDRLAVEWLLGNEQELLRSLRVAYFTALYPALPFHFRRFSYDLEYKYSGLNEDEMRGLNPEVGRKDYAEIRKELRALYLKMEKSIPRYAQARMRDHPTWDDVVRAANLHRSRSGSGQASRSTKARQPL